MDTEKGHQLNQIEVADAALKAEHDDLSHDDDQVHSEEESQHSACEANYHGQQPEQQERWEDVPSKVNTDVEGSNNSAVAPQVKSEENGKQILQKSEKPAKVANGNQTPNKSTSQKLPLKTKILPFNSSSIYAAFDLLREQFATLIPPSQGYIRVNPYTSKTDIIIFYRRQQNLQEIATKVQGLVNEINCIPIHKMDVQSGMQLSYKCFRNLVHNKMTYFKDQTVSKQGFKTAAYYLCGRVDTNVLQIKKDSMKHIRYCWVNLTKFPCSRSYKAIIRRIFDMPQIRPFVKEKLSSREIQVCNLRSGFPEPVKFSKGYITALLTLESKKIPIHKGIEQLITNYICEENLVFCFTVLRKNEEALYKYIPKVDKVVLFFINERNLDKPTTYLFIILRKQYLREVQEKLISEIDGMKLNILGRRIFKHFNPSKQNMKYEKGHKVQPYPIRRPYSWTYSSRNGEPFDWKSQIRTL